ncbi:hypothetical protein WJX72_003870 [[Myrmecia] bisecta]|uniref:DUF202 domain-containing protein n=1 Tax=[Myrmecia] bisecta TaxID=41462 RepID=A0AAW1PFM7_9CHLO
MAAALRRTEAKAFFANERTFLHWMNMSVTIGSISAAMLGISGHAQKHWDSHRQRAIFVRALALVMMAISIFMAIYATWNFKLRADMLEERMDGPYDSKVLPILLSVVLMASFLIVFGGTLATLMGLN